MITVILGFIISWFKGIGHSHAITERKLDAMASFMEDMGIDPEDPKARKAAVGILVKVHGYDPLFKAQLEARANRMSRKIRKCEGRIVDYNAKIIWLESLIAKDAVSKRQCSTVRAAALVKKEEWS